MNKIFMWALRSLLYLVVAGTITIIILYLYMETQLPNVNSLKNVQLQVPLRVYSRDNKLIAEYGEKRRIPVKFEDVPKQLIHAVLATEDQRFFEHPGVDFIGILRAAKAVAMTGRKSQGASTITMQVARNFFLSRKKTYTRKFNEVLLAIKIDRELSKEKILELYLNKIYFGQRAYGVAAAAQVYYGKKLAQLNLAQIAMLAGLPRAPSRDNPISNPRAARKRRNHVLQRMLECDYIDQATYEKAVNQPLTATYHGQRISLYAPYVAEMVRSAMVNSLGEAAYTKGLKVYTTIDSRLQTEAMNDIQQGLITYDRQHGYRQPQQQLTPPLSPKRLANWKPHPTIFGMQQGVVLQVADQSATVYLGESKATITLPWSGLAWARPYRDKRYPGPSPHTAHDILKPGDIIRVNFENLHWQLTQLPKVEGTLVSLDPNNGAILALQGGFDFDKSHYNRATQALRQPGSSFKPFIYSAALAKGYTLASLINDAPLVIHGEGDENSLWRPHNDNNTFEGPTRLRNGLIHSRNLVSIRLLQQLGIPYTLRYIKRFGFNTEAFPRTLSLALGSVTLTPLDLSAGYATFANGGYRIKPYFIDHIDDEHDHRIYTASPPTPADCDDCRSSLQLPVMDDPTTVPPPAQRALAADVAYLMNNALKDVIRHGTGRAAKILNRHDVAGKTGTTNQQVDAWFSGFTRDVVTTVWVGFDQPHSLHEYAASVALPIWIRFMKQALKGLPEHHLTQPDDIVTVRINQKTGALTHHGDNDSMFEVFRENNLPKATG